jgi:hypothetical protein
MMTSPLARRQRGIVLIITLLVLVALSLTAISLTRTVDTATLIAGNIAFKQGTTTMADRGVEAARTWLTINAGSTLESHSPGNGYFANWQDVDFIGNDPAKIDFDWNAAPLLAGMTADDPYAVRYAIHRLCELPGQPTAVPCQKTPVGGTSLSTKGAGSYGAYALATSSQVYFQVTVRVNGPRNTVSYVQAILN